MNIYFNQRINYLLAEEKSGELTWKIFKDWLLTSNLGCLWKFRRLSDKVNSVWWYSNRYGSQKKQLKLIVAELFMRRRKPSIYLVSIS